MSCQTGETTKHHEYQRTINGKKEEHFHEARMLQSLLTKASVQWTREVTIGKHCGSKRDFRLFSWAQTLLQLIAEGHHGNVEMQSRGNETTAV